MENRPYVEPELRTFETRLQFINYIFSNKYSQEEILKNCITFRLNKTYEQYLESLENSIKALRNKEQPTKILTKANKGA